jgi:hypothetical protein
VKVVPGEKKNDFLFQHGTYEMTVADGVLEKHGASKSAIDDCLKKLKDMGSYEELCQAYGYKPKDGERNPGLVIVSDVDPRVSMVVQFGSKWPNDSDYLWLNRSPVDFTLKWFLDTDGLVKEMGAGAVPERAVSDAELDLISKIREETKLESYQPMLKTLQHYKKPIDWSVPSPEQLIESKGSRMKFHEDFDKVDFFGMPLMEEVKYEKLPASAVKPEDPEKKDKEVEAKADAPSEKEQPMKHVGDEIAKPKSEADIGVESGQKELPAAEVKVGKPGEEDGKGEVVAGKGKSDDQQDELAKKEVKVGEPGEDHGKHMSETAVLRRRFARVVAENRMLKGKLSELLDRVTKIEESAKSSKPVQESKMGMARQRMELKKAGLKERMSEMKKPEAKEPVEGKELSMEQKKAAHAAKVRERLKAKMESRKAEKA